MNYAKGCIGVRWAASDPNGDDLVYKVEIRGVQENEWKLLRDKLKEKFLSWESNTFPDGEYIVRVTASDSPDNPPDQALTASIESERFIIDNTAPKITGLTGRQDRIQGDACAGELPMTAASSKRPSTRSTGATGSSYSRQRVCPMLPTLQYELTLDAPGTAERTIAIRVTDEYDNQSVEKVVVQ